MKLYHNVYGHKISDEFDFGRNRAIRYWVICPWISKNAINHFVYTLAPSFLHQFWLYLHRMFITIRNSMSSILNDRTRVTGPWFYENCVIISCLHSSNHKYLSILMKLYHNVYGHKILDEFDYGHCLPSKSRVICPWISKNDINHFVYTLAPSFLHQLNQ